MTAEPELNGQLAAAIYQTIANLPAQPDPYADLEAIVHEWDALDEALGMLKARVQAWALRAGDALSDLEYNRREGLNVDGQVFHHVQYRTDRWDGQGVLDRLVTEVASTETGETFDAVAREVLDDVLPAVREGRVSSRWLRSGLLAWGVNPDSVCRSEWSEPVIKRGPMP